MSRTKVKICGLTNLEDARFAAGALVDYLGFIFYDKSPRYIEPGEAGAIINWIEGPEKIGVFVNQPLDDVNRIAKETGLDLIQLHGDESVEYCSLVEKPVIKVIHITEGVVLEDLRTKVHSYSEAADFLLFDSKIGDQWGGTGTTFDWSILSKITGDVPFFLSGGLNPSNITEAISATHPFAVDVNSGIEEKPGLKDFDKVDALMEELRSIWEKQDQ